MRSKKSIAGSLALIFLLVLILVPSVNAATYVWRRYLAIKYAEGYWVVNSNQQYGGPYQGYANYSFNATTGTYSLFNPKTLRQPMTLGDFVYISGGSSLTRIQVGGGNTVRYGNKNRTTLSPAGRGNYLGFVFSSSSSSYPSNGVQGDYWYVSSSEEDYYRDLGILYPFRGSNPPKRISSRWGPRNLGDHAGIDIPASNGTALYPVFNAKVNYVGNDTAGAGHWFMAEATGSYNVCNSSTKLRFVYCHLDEAARVYHSNGTTTLLAANSSINSSDHVGKVGTTGAVSTGNHLHLAFNIDGTYGIKKANCIDPEWLYPSNFFTY